MNEKKVQETVDLIQDIEEIMIKKKYDLLVCQASLSLLLGKSIGDFECEEKDFKILMNYSLQSAKKSAIDFRKMNKYENRDK